MQEKLTVILFKNHLTARTFEVSLRKLERVGISFVVVIFLALFSSLFFVRAGVKMLNSKDGRSIERVNELEKQLAEMKSSYEALQGHVSGSTTAGSNLSQSSLRSVLFTSIPTASIRSPIPPRDSLPFRLDTLKAHWQGNFLNISTAIEYNRGDEGTQQGNFFIVAQGPQNMYAHPEGAFSEAGSETLIDPESGEYFSVARYREIRARFGPVERRDQIQSVSVYIFDRNKNLIFLDRVALKDAEKNTLPPPTIQNRKAPAPSSPKEEPPSAAPNAGDAGEGIGAAGNAETSSVAPSGESGTKNLEKEIKNESVEPIAPVPAPAGSSGN